MGGYYLAVDIGASSGRHMLGYLQDGKIKVEEIYRFENGMTDAGGSLVWDTRRLFAEIRAGMKKCADAGRIPETMSVDTWAVDYVLLDREDRELGSAYAYRDGRTRDMDRRVYETIAPEALYARTGIQKQPFNTIYQLMADRVQRPEILERAGTFLMLPDYFHFLLTGKKMSEYTNATSTQLVSPVKKQWDRELIRMLGYPEEMFLPLRTPGTEVGGLRAEVAKEVGFDCRVVLCGSHDTASAVMAAPRADGNALYISSGTWSLMGVELAEADCREESRRANFTNEGGYDYRFRYLKNIMGLWMIQSVRHELGDKYSFGQLCDMAREAGDFPSRVEVNDACFLAPENMTEAIRAYCERTGQRIPETVGELACVIYRSLADSYGETVGEIERNTGRRYDSIAVIGGGSNASYLNQLTAQATGKTVYAGPSEATAIGNILAQMIAAGELDSLETARACVAASFPIQKYQP
ncbi:MAG: rhamnulokinase [Acetatifactor sp.]